MKQISVLGCGWLGFALAQHLLNNGYAVNGSTTSENKIEGFSNAGINPFLIILQPKSIVGEIEQFLKGSEILIIDIPPKLRGAERESFIGKVNTLLPFIEQSGILNVIFISSISVYADEDLVVTENTFALPETESGKELLASENLLVANKAFQTTVVRFGGLIGPNRHPVNSLSGKENLPNPQSPVNLIHLQDCIGIIESIIRNQAWGEIFNAVAPFHPSRLEYYSAKAMELGLALPQFSVRNQQAKGKIISSDKVLKKLDYQFKVGTL